MKTLGLFEEDDEEACDVARIDVVDVDVLGDAVDVDVLGDAVDAKLSSASNDIFTTSTIKVEKEIGKFYATLKMFLF